MKKYRALIAFLATFCLSALIFYLSGLPLERGPSLAFWASETTILATVASMVAEVGA